MEKFTSSAGSMVMTLDVPQQETDVYDPRTDGWKKLADMPMAKSHMEGGDFVLNGQIIFAGGQTVNSVSTNNVFAYNRAMNSWSTLAPLPQPRPRAVVAAIGDKIVITVGGDVTDDPRSETWIGILS